MPQVPHTRLCQYTVQIRRTARHSRHRVVEHRLSRPRAGCCAAPRRPDPGRAARPLRSARLAAPQPHRRLPLGRRRQPWPGRLQAASGHGRKPAHGLRRVTVFPVRAANRAILPVLSVA